MRWVVAHPSFTVYLNLTASLPTYAVVTIVSAEYTHMEYSLDLLGDSTGTASIPTIAYA